MSLSVGSAPLAPSYFQQAENPRQASNSARANQPGALTGLRNEQENQDALAVRNNGKQQAEQAKRRCETCDNRKYQDGSDDPGVSFKSATRVDPGVAASAVMGHEREHVSHEQAKAKIEGREIVSQSVTLHSGICGECGRTYVAGGTTRTVSRAKSVAERYQVGLPTENGEGRFSAVA